MLLIGVGLMAFGLRRRHMREVELAIAGTDGLPVGAV
jgi:hypothetical protein